MIPSVIDANVINEFQNERVAAAPSSAHLAIEAICQNGHIVLDDEDKCRSEWIACAEGAFPLLLADWIADMMRAEKIQLVSFSCDNMHKELTSLGVPKLDHKWVRLARSAQSPIIATNDIDLIDPRKKGSVSGAARTKILEASKVPVSKHLRKKYGISVCCSAKVADFFA